MGLYLATASIYFLVASSFRLLCGADDNLVVGSSLSLNETLTSLRGSYALGFFSTEKSVSDSGNRYVGIWYNNIPLPQRTVVWVANRETPLSGSAGELRIIDDGNLALLDAAGKIVWSSNISASSVRGNSSAVLLDSGNLVLRNGEGKNLWQTFDHPTDTYLSTMEFDFDYRTGTGRSLVSWRSPQDPSAGRFTVGIDPASPLQLAIKNGSRTVWRSNPWDGKQVTGTLDVNSSSLIVQTITVNGQKVTLTYTTTGLLALSRLTLDSGGHLNFLYWNDQSSNWTLALTRPSAPCEIYGRCGPFGVCDPSGRRPLCRCLGGFEPKQQEEWARENFIGGCVRTQSLKCDQTDVFLPSAGLKLPDNFKILWNVTAAECEASCRDVCRCSAYTFANVTVGTVPSSRCLIWDTELIDFARLPVPGEDLFVRLVASELDANSDKSTRNLPEIMVPTICAVLLIAALLYLLWMRHKRKVKRARNGLLYDAKRFSEMIGKEKDVIEVPLLDFSVVVAATGNFASVNRLGEGGFGPVYKGTLLHGHEVAVKRLSQRSGQGFQEFDNEIKLIAKLQHTNLVRILGWCSHEDEKILVYEYMPNGSLDKFIFDQRRFRDLGWEKRFKIIKGIADGLLYLHRHSRLRIIHRDLKASNILLDASMNPKISDFGLARIFGDNQKEASTEKIVGTFGYMSPEYALDGWFSEKSDVFSFGVMVLEIITGKRSTGFYPYKDSLNLLSYVWNMWSENRALELVDNVSVGGGLCIEDAMRCIQVGLLCAQDNATERPTMSSVVFMLGKENSSLPTPKQPTFATRSATGLLTTSSTEDASEITIDNSE